MKRIIFFSLLALAITISCSKNEDSPQQNSVLNYYPLDIGNYWVFERSACDSTWSDCDHISTDTNWISKDTIINNKTYYKLEGRGLMGIYTRVYLRDSGNYIVNQSGDIVISDTDFDRKLYERYEINKTNNDTLAYIYKQIKDKPNNVAVPAGNFNCIDFRGSFFRLHDDFKTEHNYHNYYAEYVGPVYENATFLMSLGGFQRELVSFQVKDYGKQ